MGGQAFSRTAGDYFTYLIAMPRSVDAFSELDLPLCGDYGGVRGSSPHTEMVKRRLVTSDLSMVNADVALKRRGTRRPIAETMKSGSCYRSREFGGGGWPIGTICFSHKAWSGQLVEIGDDENRAKLHSR